MISWAVLSLGNNICRCQAPGSIQIRVVMLMMDGDIQIK